MRGFENPFFRKVSAQLMNPCGDCQQAFADIDGTCALCRSLRRLCLEARRVTPALRGWVVDQTRVWVSLLQEESQKWEAAQEEARRREESRLAAEAATSKAASPVVAGSHPAEAEVTEEVEPVKAPTVKVKEERECIISPGTVSSPPESKEEIVEEEPTPPPKVSLEKTEVKKKKKKKKAEEPHQEEKEKSVKKEKTASKKDKVPKRKRKSSSRSRRRRRRSDSRRRSPSRSRRRTLSPQRRPPPEPVNPPSNWRGEDQVGRHYTPKAREYQSYSTSQWTYTPSYREYAEESPPRWGKNKGLTKRKKQAEWRSYNYGYR